MALRQQASRLSKARVSKLRRTRRPSKQRYQPLLENLEPRLALTGAWSTLAVSNSSLLTLGGVQSVGMLSDGRAMLAANNAPNLLGVDSTTWLPLSPNSAGSYVNGSFGAPSTMNTTRLIFPSLTLPDGRIFAIGGEFGDTVGFVNSPEIYDPLTNAWTK